MGLSLIEELPKIVAVRKGRKKLNGYWKGFRPLIS